ncbi:hypothetical protein LIER_13077 [Lithospermum erythrorhizon]|uniref:Uncharacterized protein n=1 Tax=Lithospermum erythrorhizon TaxID=34254 RepID=A0AAV3PZC6_LITER
MLNTLKERAKAQEAARRAQAELEEPVPLQVIPPLVMSPVEETQQSPLGLEITSNEGEPGNMQDVPKSPTVKDSDKDFNPSSEFCDKRDNVEGQNVPSDSPRPEPESNFDEDRPIEVEVSDDDAEGAPVKFVRKPTSPTAATEEDDDIVIVSSTASKRRTRASTAALKKKKGKLGLGGDSSNTDETVDLDDLEKKAAEKERSRKGKRSAEGKSTKFVFKKRKGIEIPEKGDKFVIDDEESSEEDKKGLDVLRKEDDTGEDAKSLTISDKLMKGKHMVDIDVSASKSSEAVPEGNAAELLLKVYEDELKVAEAEIQAKTIRASDLRAKIAALRVRVNPSVNTPAGTFTSGDGPSSSRM